MGWQAWKERWQGPGGGGEVMRLALPLIVSNSFWTMQITIDRVLLSRYSSDAMAAAWAGVQFYWTTFILFQSTAAYATTFVAQYVGAGRPERVGPVIWQSLRFSVGAGLLFLLLLFVIGDIVRLGDHTAELQKLEAAYLHCLCFA